MNQDPLDPEGIGDGTGVLPSCSSETSERVARDIMAARNRNLPNCSCHIVDGNLEKTLGDVFEALAVAQLCRDLLEPQFGGVAVERLVAARAKNGREMLRVDASKEQI